MIFIEMSRVIEHGGGSWAFPNCVWAPTKKKAGGRWVFWSKVQEVQDGDIIIHLRGKSPDARFVGFSIASGNGFITTNQPPINTNWSYSKEFFKANLKDFTPFSNPINLLTIFENRRDELEKYFLTNKERGTEKLNLFYVIQNNELQCLNGAYFSDADEGLLIALFGDSNFPQIQTTLEITESVDVGTQLRLIQARQGQQSFSNKIKDLYGNKCCFPGCNVDDKRFLIGSHIARWSDNIRLRGELGNGLCFCLIHDKAFELGLFTIDENLNVFVKKTEEEKNSELSRNLIKSHGMKIRTAKIKLLEEALLEHWIRVRIDPFNSP